eukprot:scaffold27529_cov65-Phaeocystis_antarctica.AAC.1
MRRDVLHARVSRVERLLGERGTVGDEVEHEANGRDYAHLHGERVCMAVGRPPVAPRAYLVRVKVRVRLVLGLGLGLCLAMSLPMSSRTARSKASTAACSSAGEVGIEGSLRTEAPKPR